MTTQRKNAMLKNLNLQKLLFIIASIFLLVLCAIQNIANAVNKYKINKHSHNDEISDVTVVLNAIVSI